MNKMRLHHMLSHWQHIDQMEFTVLIVTLNISEFSSFFLICFFNIYGIILDEMRCKQWQINNMAATND